MRKRAAALTGSSGRVWAQESRGLRLKIPRGEVEDPEA